MGVFLGADFVPLLVFGGLFQLTALALGTT